MASSGDPAVIARAIREGDRRAMARAITRLESTREEDYAAGQAILEEMIEDCLLYTSDAADE